MSEYHRTMIDCNVFLASSLGAPELCLLWSMFYSLTLVNSILVILVIIMNKGAAMCTS